MRICAGLLMLVFVSFATLLPAQTEVAGTDILFARYYVNWAEMFTFKGVTIDSAGQVYEFDYGYNGRMPDFDRNALTSEQLNTLFQPGRKLIRTIEPQKLQQMIALVPDAATASMSERVHEASDMGSNCWKAYQFNVQNSLFREIDLKTKGDWSYHNLATAASELVELLNASAP